MTATAEGDAPGWRFIGAADGGTWGKWVKPYDATNAPNSSGRRVEPKRQPIAPPPIVSDEARDRAYRAILAQLSLSQGDRDELRSRGMSDTDIDVIGFKTWIANTTLSGDFPLGLPGLRGKTLAARSGYLIPVRDANGAILGLQVRPHEAGKTDTTGQEIPKYTWVSASSAPIGGDHQEWPLAVYRGGQARGSQPIGLAEGTAAKPFLSAQRSGYSIVGAAGGMWTKSPSRLKRILKDLGAKRGDAITLFADAGSFSNKHVKRRYTELYKLLKSWGLKLYVASWGQLNSKRKGDPKRGDFDEIAETPWRLFNWEQPNDVEKAGGIGFLWDEVRRCVERDRYDKLTAWTEDQATIITDGRYIPLDTWQRLNKPGLHLTRAVPGSGKFFALMKPIVHDTLAQQALDQGKRVLSVTVRRTLGEEQQTKLPGLQFLTPDNDSINSRGLCVCWESLNKLSGQYFDLILIDEVRTGFGILATSPTLKKSRAITRAIVEQLFQKTIQGGGTIIGLDADVDDRTIRYLSSICGLEKPTEIHYHDQLPVPRNVYATPFSASVNEIKVNGRAVVMGLFKAHVLMVCRQIQDSGSLNKINLPMLVSDSRSMIEDLVTVSEGEMGEELAEFLAELQSEIDQEFSDSPIRFSVLRIDSKTRSEPAAIDYTTDPTHRKGNAIAVAITPSAFVGVSDEDDRIATVYGVFHGVTGVNLARQALGRARRAQNWVIAYADSFALADGRPSRQTDPTKVLSEIQDKQPTESGLEAIVQEAKAKFGDDVGAIVDYLNECGDRESRLWRNIHTEFASQEWAIANYERAHFGELFIERLDREGHQMRPFFDALRLAGIQIKNDDDFIQVIRELELTKGKTDEARAARQEREADALAYAAINSEMDVRDARTILEDDRLIDERGKTHPVTEEDRIEARAVLLRDRYPDLVVTADEQDAPPKPVWGDPELARQFCLDWVIKDRDLQKQAYRAWAFKNWQAAKRISILHTLGFAESAAKGRNTAAIDDRGGDRRPSTAAYLLQGINIAEGMVITAEDLRPAVSKGSGEKTKIDSSTLGVVFERWNKIRAKAKHILGFDLRKGPNAKLEFFAQLLEVAGFKVAKNIKRKKSISVIETDRFFAGAVEAIARAKAIELAELENPDLKIARLDQERQARADRRAAKAAALAAQAETQPIAPLAEPITTQAIAPVENAPTHHAVAAEPIDPRLDETAQYLANLLDGQINYTPADNRRAAVVTGDWRIDIVQDSTYKSGFRFDAVDTAGSYRVAIVRDIQAKIQGVRDWLNQKPATVMEPATQEPIAQEPTAQTETPLARAQYLYSLWVAGDSATAAEAIKGWFKAVDRQSDPLGLSRLKTAVCQAMPGIQAFWDYAATAHA